MDRVHAIQSNTVVVGFLILVVVSGLVQRNSNCMSFWISSGLEEEQGSHSPLHNVHFGNYDGPVVKMALYMLQGHIM